MVKDIILAGIKYKVSTKKTKFSYVRMKFYDSKNDKMIYLYTNCGIYMATGFILNFEKIAAEMNKIRLAEIRIISITYMK